MLKQTLVEASRKRSTQHLTEKTLSAAFSPSLNAEPPSSFDTIGAIAASMLTSVAQRPAIGSSILTPAGNALDLEFFKMDERDFSREIAAAWRGQKREEDFQSSEAFALHFRRCLSGAASIQLLTS